jgi:hypothetical protein
MHTILHIHMSYSWGLSGGLDEPSRKLLTDFLGYGYGRLQARHWLMLKFVERRSSMIAGNIPSYTAEIRSSADWEIF